VLYREQRDPAGVSPQFDCEDLVYVYMYVPVNIHLCTDMEIVFSKSRDICTNI